MRTSLAVERDMVNGTWRCHLGGDGNPVVITETLHAMESFLDWYEQQSKEHDNAGTEQETR
jgi:hypothetical protein